MARRDNDYDSVFKTLKARDTRLFIPVINDALGKTTRWMPISGCWTVMGS